jgi:hypothetical protein
MDIDDEEPAQEMPTVEEVREWREAKNEAASRGILITSNGAGIAYGFRMAEAEKHYEALGLL